MSEKSIPEASRGAVVLTVVAVAAAIALFAYVRLRVGNQPQFASSSALPADRDTPIVVGGIQRPQTDIPGADGSVRSQEFEVASRAIGTGQLRTDQVSRLVTPRSVSISRETNAAAAAAIDAYTNGTNPERLTPTLMPAAFDLQSYELDPSVYLSSAEPGRVWQTAQPGPGIVPLRRQGKASLEMQQFESIRLNVTAKPGAPVSFMAFDGGVFGNSLPMISLAADSEGTATAVYTAAAGVIENVNILAGSPLHSGQVRFLVNVEEAVADR